MKLVVFSHKQVWKSDLSPIGYATDGGFAFHMKAISQLFESTTVVVPEKSNANRQGEVQFSGNIKILPVKDIRATGLKRKMLYPFWLASNAVNFRKLIKDADAVHVPIPSDMGTIPMVMAKVMGKPLFVRHCGNWYVQATAAEQFWKWFMEKYAGGLNVMLTTGGSSLPPSEINPNIKWIFSTSLWDEEIIALKDHSRKLDRQKVKLIIVCRQEVEKGTGRVIEALNLLKGETLNFQLSVVGDGPALGTFKALVQNLGLSDRVTFHGKLDHDGVIELLKASHVFVYPTTASEGFPKVVLEALASGLPVISTPVSVIPELLKSGAGVVIKNTSPASIAESIMAVISTNDDYDTMQQVAKNTAGQYSLEKWRDNIGSHLKSAWGNRWK
ncbi:MAG: glycosyltransferase [Bacteroidota bacterium]|nr:glycosyltransferase [Bacteroidota bacterium]